MIQEVNCEYKKEDGAKETFDITPFRDAKLEFSESDDGITMTLPSDHDGIEFIIEPQVKIRITQKPLIPIMRHEIEFTTPTGLAETIIQKINERDGKIRSDCDHKIAVIDTNEGFEFTYVSNNGHLVGEYDFKFCPDCGHDLRDNTNKPEEPKQCGQ